MQPQTFDFGRPFTFVFEDPRWLSKVLIGGLFLIGIIILIGPLFAMGYCARLARNVAAGQRHPLPEWDDLGEYFAEGLRMLAVILLYDIPLVLLFGILLGPSVVMEAVAHHHRAVRELGGIFGGFASCLIAPISLVVGGLWLPGALMFTVMERSFGAAFDFPRIWHFIRDNMSNYLLAFVVYLLSRFIAGAGFALCCIGIVFTVFWQMLASSYGYAEAWRLARNRP